MKPLFALAFCFVLLSGTESALALEIRGLRSGVEGPRHRIVFDVSGPAAFKAFTLSSPDRLVIDFSDMKPSDLSLPTNLGGLVRRIRYAPRGSRGFRVVFDLSTSIRFKQMVLGPTGSSSDRVVFDLFRDRGVLSAPISSVADVSEGGGRRVDDASNISPTLSVEQGPASLLYSNNQQESGEEGHNGPSSPESSNRTRQTQPGSVFSQIVQNADVSGHVAAEVRGFVQSPQSNGKPDVTGSVSIKPEFYWTWANDRQSLLFVPFVRLDDNDKRRTHTDIRELSYIYAASEWELRAGIRKVFWGVAESNHLVDIINQTDLIENLDGEDKLGQPMVNLALIKDWGTLDFFILPGFRERTFGGRDTRLQPPLRVSTSLAEYESSAEDRRVDFAGRYSTYVGVFDIGMYHFWGTSREPRFRAQINAANEPILVPIYDVIHQTGTDIQATVDNWLLKFEALRRQGQGDTFFAAVGGFEYTFVGAFDTVIDLGVLGEYHWDERGQGSASPFNNDVFVGTRLAFNDAADSQLLGGISGDLNDEGYFVNVEASRRFGNYWKIELELRLLLDIAPTNPLHSIHKDDYVQLEIFRYF